MATATKAPATSTITTPANPFSPVAWEEHQAEKERRKAEREKKRPTLRACLDHTVAAQFEARKALYRWRVECTYMRPDAKGRLQTHSATEEVVAQTEADAWAVFCDKRGTWPGPNDCERVITKLGEA